MNHDELRAPVRFGRLEGGEGSLETARAGLYLFETKKSIERIYIFGMLWSVSSLIRLSSSSGLSYVILLCRRSVWGWRMKAILCHFDDNTRISKVWVVNLVVVYCHQTNTSDCYFGRSSRVVSDVHTTIQQPQETTLAMQDY